MKRCNGPARSTCSTQPRRVRHLTWPIVIAAGLAACLGDEAGDRLGEESESLGAAGEEEGVSAAIVPPPGQIVDTQPSSGWTEGSFSVSHDGAAEYHLPLWVPDGRRGFEPELALHYNSRGGNGAIGVGWSLQGLSTVVPCPRTIAQDGRREGVSYTGDDVYCLDGQRLRPTAANGWPTVLDREYRTERDIFARIIAHTPAPVVPGQLQPQPQYFKVWTRDGRILTLGGNGDADYKVNGVIGIQPETPAFAPGPSGNILAWALRTAEDRNGNSISFEYAHVDTGSNSWDAEQMMPDRITYGPDRRVELVYEDRPDLVDEFRAGRSGGMPTGLARRLKTIQMFAGTELLREYRLGYRNDSTTARSLLRSVTECDRNAVCLFPLEFDWSLGSYTFTDVTTDVTDVGVFSSSGHRFIAGDIDGDGADDLLYGDELNQWKMRFSNRSNGFSAAQSVGIARPRGPDYKPVVRPIDYNRDGRLDLMVELAAGPVATRLVLYRSNGSSYSAVSPELDDLLIGENGLYSAYFVDLDGNGRPDYLGPKRLSESLLQWRFRLSSGSLQFQPMVETLVASTFSLDPEHQIRATDFDGDGRGELLVQNLDAGRYERIGYAGTALSKSSNNLNLPFERVPENDDRTSLHFADVNGDGLEDAIYPYSGLRVQLNSGRGFSHISSAASEYRNPVPITVGIERGVRIVDFNNDGADDVLIFHRGVPTDVTDYTRGFHLYVWRTNRFVRISLNRDVSDILGGDRAVEPLDIDGDGALDIAHLYRKNGNTYLRVLKRNGGVPDRLVRVRVAEASLADRVEVDYTTLADTTAHTPDLLCAVPLVCPRRGGSIVSRHRLANGLASRWRQFSHRYTHARIDPLGRGWLGFAQHQVTDEERSGATTTMTFDNTARLALDFPGGPGHVYPLVGLPTLVEYRVDAEPPLDWQYRRVSSRGYDFRPGNVPGTVVIERLSGETDTDSERRGGGNWVELHRRSVQFDYDEYLNMTVSKVVVPGSDRLTTTSYRNDATSWLIGLPETQRTTSCTRPDAACQTRESEFDHDASGNLEEVTIEPNVAGLRLTSVIAYGAFGNIESITTTDAEGEERSASLTYDARSLYPASATNALGHTTRLTSHPALGVLLDRVDPNNVTTTMNYDRFGRLREVKYADGYFERFATLGPLVHFTTFPTSAGGATVTSTLTILDGLGRERERQVPGFGGGTSMVRTTHDELGRVATVSRPFLTGETVRNTTFHYDTRDRLTSMVEPDGATVRHEYIGLETHTYDAKDNHSYVLERADGRIDSRFEDDPDSTSWLLTRFEYAAFGLLSRMVSPDGTSQAMDYDRRGRRIEHVDPSTGTTTWSYNAFGEPIDETDGNGRLTEFEYDDLGRVTRIQSPDGPTTNTWDVAQNGIGKLFEAVSPDGIVTRHAYDDTGRGIRTIWTVEGTQYRLDYGYDNIGRLTSITYPALPGVSARLKADYIYQAQGYLSRVQDAPTGTPYWQVDARDAAFQLKHEIYGNNIVTGTREYEATTGLLRTLRVDGPGGQLDLLSYGYDRNRNVTSRIDNGGVNTKNQTYTYDALDRLATWTVKHSTTDLVTSTFAYDDLGNLLSETVAGRTGRNVAYGYAEDGAPPHALTSRNGARYTYDDAGRQITGPDRTVTYNRLGLPTRLTRTGGAATQFRYDAAGARILKRDAEQTIVSVAGLFERRTAADVRNVHYIIADGRSVAQVTRTQATAGGPITATELRYLHADGQGSIVQATDQAGTVVEEFFYDPFGRRTNANYDIPLAPQRRPIRPGYTGHDHDDELGLINMQGRIYEPAARRFLTPDPFIQAPLFSQSHNRYSYVWNNPATFTDPTGFATSVGEDCPAEGCSSGTTGPVGPTGTGGVTIINPPEPGGEQPTIECIGCDGEQIEPEYEGPPVMGERPGGPFGDGPDSDGPGGDRPRDHGAGDGGGPRPPSTDDNNGTDTGRPSSGAPSGGGGSLGAGRDPSLLAQYPACPECIHIQAQSPTAPLARGLAVGVLVSLVAVVSPGLAAVLAMGTSSGEDNIVILPVGLGGAARGPAAAKDVVVPSSRYPQTAGHIRDAQAAGHPSVLTIERAGADANRAAAQAGHKRVPGTQLDEYPPAMFREGGAGASIRPVSPRDNMGAGACIGNQCRGLPDGTRVRIRVE